MKRILNQLVVVSMVSLLPSGAFAGVIYEQSVDLTAGAATSDFGTNSQIADRFQLEPGASTITEIHWWGVYGASNQASGPDDFTIRFFIDVGTPVIDPQHEFAVGDVGRVDTGLIIDRFGTTFDVYAYSADIAALMLPAGAAFWLSIVNDTDDSWQWSSESGQNSQASRDVDGQEWFSGNLSMGYQLTDDALAVPEPASLALFGVGLAGLGAMGWRRRKC